MGKDDLYLACVSRCFDDVTAYLQGQNLGADLHRYMEYRFRYFSDHPLCAGLFFEAVLQPPAALVSAIRERKRAFDQLNQRIYREALSAMKLRREVTEAEGPGILRHHAGDVQWVFQQPGYAGKDFKTVVADHEDKLAKMLDLMLYGIAERGSEK